MSRLIRCFALILLTVGLAHAQPAPFVEKPISKAQLKKLQDGGYVIYMRHGKTDASRPDQPKVDFKDCQTQRPLSDEGRAMAAEIGKAFKTAHIPIGDIYVSPMCRTRESAEKVFGKDAKFNILDDLYSSTNQTSEEKKPIIATTRRLLSEAVPAGKNRFILAHAPNLADTMGYFPKVEATVVIFIPHGQEFEYVGSIRPDQWRDLLH